jgi:hypothetical protein
MKNAVKLFFALLTVALIPNLASAQPPPVDVDNQTACVYRVKANVTTVGGCPMGMGPVMNCPPGMVTTLIATPPPALQVVAYGVNLLGTPPFVVGDGACGFPVVVTLPAAHPNACGGAITTFTYSGKLLRIL